MYEAFSEQALSPYIIFVNNNLGLHLVSIFMIGKRLSYLY